MAKVVLELKHLQDIFENWHRTTNQAKRYKLSYRKSHDLQYWDNRTVWAFIAFQGGYKEALKSAGCELEILHG